MDFTVVRRLPHEVPHRPRRGRSVAGASRGGERRARRRAGRARRVPPGPRDHASRDRGRRGRGPLLRGGSSPRAGALSPRRGTILDVIDAQVNLTRARTAREHALRRSTRVVGREERGRRSRGAGAGAGEVRVSLIDFRGVTKRYDMDGVGSRGAGRRGSLDRRERVRRDHGAFRLGQVHVDRTSWAALDRPSAGTYRLRDRPVEEYFGRRAGACAQPGDPGSSSRRST